MWIKLTSLKAYTSNGKVYAYDRLSGAKLTNTPVKRAGHWYGDEKLVKELAELRKPKIGDGTVRALIADYKRSDVSVRKRKAFMALAPRTRADYNKDFDRLCAATIDGRRIEEAELDAVTVHVVRALRDGWAKKYGATQAIRIMRACSVLWSYALEYGLAVDNPWRAVKLPQVDKKAAQINRPWAASEVWFMLRTAPHIGLARAYALALMGLRPEQIPTLTLRELAGLTRAKKTGAEHHLAIPSALRPYFDETLSSIMVSNGPDGTPWRTYGQLRAAFNRHRASLLKDKLIEPGLTLKGLNHTLGAALVEKDASDKEMEATMARSATMVRHYSERANRISLSESGFGLLSDWLAQSKDAVKMSKRSDTT